MRIERTDAERDRHPARAPDDLPSSGLAGRDGFYPQPGYSPKMGFVSGADEHAKPEVGGCGGDGKVVGRNEPA